MKTGSIESLHSVSPFGALALDVIQRIAVRWKLRGMPRLVWLSRRLLGAGVRVMWYQKRFQVICDCDSYYSLMTISGFVHRDVDRLLSMLIQGCDRDVTFVDVGANVGFVSLLACSSTKGDQKVQAHCFEPDPRALEFLAANASLNGYQIILNDCALGAVQGEFELKLAAESCRSCLLPEPPGGFSFTATVGQKQVEMTTLDAYCAERAVAPDIVKVDVEGYEPYVLQGAADVLQRDCPFLIVEVNVPALAAGGNSADDFLDLIRGFGYRLFHVNYMQAGLSRQDVSDRQAWRGYVTVYPKDASVERRFFDVLAVPASNVDEFAGNR